MSSHNNFCKQPLGITGYPECNIVGSFLSLKDLEVLCQFLMIHLALKHSCQEGERFGRRGDCASLQISCALYC